MELRVERVCKSYRGEAVLENVTFSAGPGITCVMAPSGRGKTTLLRLLLGLERPDSGTISGGLRWSAVFQEDRLLEGLDALGNLRFVLGPGMDRAAALSLLAALGLEAGEKPVREFSGGMRRRLALARALLAPFDALALDEPFTGLDAQSRQQCREVIRRYGAGKTVLLVTHDRADPEELGARVLRL